MQIPTIATARLNKGIGLPSKQPKEATGLPSEQLCEGSHLPFVHWLLSLHMDKAQQGQLLLAWLSADGGPPLSAWQTFLDQCDHIQVMCSQLVACAYSVGMHMNP